MTNIIEVKNLVKRYKGAKVDAVSDVSFDVKKGEFFTLLGPNGAGKTTTISVLNTTLSKTAGSVKVDGLEIDDDPDRVREKIGVIFQNPSLDQNLTAEENVRFHAVLYGLYSYRPFFSMMPVEYRDKVNELAEILGIGKEMHQPIKTFSGGMKRKLEIVRGLIHKPKILFLDEPTTGLDPLSRKKLWQYLKEVRRDDGITLFLTTHYLEEAEGADTICIVDHGRVVSLGTTGEIKKDLVDEYLILDVDERESLRKELKEMKLQYEEDGQFHIQIKNSQVQEVLSRLKTKIKRIQLHTPTLEEAYLEIINRDIEENEASN
jgi:ABC-2 type transport system ATP-binding protein